MNVPLTTTEFFNLTENSLVWNNQTFSDRLESFDPENCSSCLNELCIPEADYNVYRSWVSVDTFEMVLIAINIIVFLAGIIGNSLVFIAVTTTKSMQSVTNIFIVNLAMADMLVMLFCAPPSVIWDVTNTWIFGSLMCRIVIYIQDISVSVSVLTLTFIAYDRYYAICRPLQFSTRKTKAAVVIAAIWTISGMIGIPDAISLRSVTPFSKEDYPCRADEIQFDLSTCKPTWSENVDFFFTLTKALLLYTLPLTFMCIAYYYIVKTLWRRNNIPGSQETRDGHPQRNSSSLTGLANANSTSAISLASTPVGGGSSLPKTHNSSTKGFGKIPRSSTSRAFATNASSNPLRNGQINESPEECISIAAPNTVTNRANPTNRTLDNQLRTRRKVAKMLIAVVIMFSINFFPVHFLPILQFVVDRTLTEGSPAYEKVMVFLVNGSIITHCMCYFNSAINPIIYYFMSAQFKAQYRRILSCRCVADSPSPKITNHIQAPHRQMRPPARAPSANNHKVLLNNTRHSQSCRIPMAMTRNNCLEQPQPYCRPPISISSSTKLMPDGVSPKKYRPTLERSKRFDEPIEENSLSLTSPFLDCNLLLRADGCAESSYVQKKEDPELENN